MEGISILIVYLLGALLVFEIYTLQGRHSIEFRVFASVFYPLIWLVWLFLFILAIVADAIYTIGDKIRVAKGRPKNNE